MLLLLTLQLLLLPQITFYSNTAYAGTIYDMPLSMTCPGSKAHEFFRCFAHPAASGKWRYGVCVEPITAGALQPATMRIGSTCACAVRTLVMLCYSGDDHRVFRHTQ